MKPSHFNPRATRAHRLSNSLFLTLLLLASFFILSVAQECSESIPCKTGCCSKWGHCGWGDDFCGKGCVNSCDARKDCDEKNPCKFGCCSKFGFCGLGKDFCSKENCVSGCETKSQCDPGWGLDYSNHSTCPLNVCCSKHGFCGNKKVQRPSCDASKGKEMGRVIGYYEAWATHRPCHSIEPEDLVPGVYTHINFAFGTIDPSSFEVRPAGRNDERLWGRINNFRLRDAGVKIWLAIGGWTFNDADQPTHMTFSDLVASEERQNAFFKSVISLMQTYGFEGIDLDW